MWQPHAALIPIYCNQARPVRLPLPIIPGVNATAHPFGGFGLTSGSVLNERNHGLILVTARCQRRAGLNLLRGGLGGSPFGGEVIVVLPVPCCARRAPGLALDGCSRAVIAHAEFLAALAFFSGAYAVAFSLLFLRKAGPSGVGGFLVFGGACSGFAAGIGGFGLLGACFAGVSRLGEDEGELERAAYCTCVQGSMSTLSTLLLEHHLKELKLPTFLREYRKLAT